MAKNNLRICGKTYFLKFTSLKITAMLRILYIVFFFALAVPAHAQKPIKPKGYGGAQIPSLTGRWMADSSISISSRGPRRDVNLNLIYTFTADSTMLIAKGDEAPKVIGTYSLSREGNKWYMTLYKDGKPMSVKMELQGVTNNYMAIFSDYPAATSTQYFTRLDKK
jgi:hypothetical protein